MSEVERMMSEILDHHTADDADTTLSPGADTVSQAEVEVAEVDAPETPDTRELEDDTASDSKSISELHSEEHTADNNEILMRR